MYIKALFKAETRKKLSSLLMTVALLCNSFLFLLPQTATAETLNAYRWRNDDGTEVTATWAAAENTTIALAKNDPKRLRFGVTNDGTEKPLSITDNASRAGTGSFALSFIDSSATYGYIAIDEGTTCKLQRMRLSDNAELGSVTIGSCDSIQDGVIDKTNGFAYIATAYDPGAGTNGYVTKINLGTLTAVSTLQFGTGYTASQTGALVLDPAGTYLFLGTYVSAAACTVYKIDTSGSMSVSGSQLLNNDHRRILSGVADSTYIYFGGSTVTSTTQGTIIQIRQSDIGIQGEKDLTTSPVTAYLRSGFQDGTYVYFGMDPYSVSYDDGVVRVELGANFATDTPEYLWFDNPGGLEEDPQVATVDTTGATDYGYFGGSGRNGDGAVIRVNLTTFSSTDVTATAVSKCENPVGLDMNTGTGEMFLACDNTNYNSATAGNIHTEFNPATMSVTDTHEFDIAQLSSKIILADDNYVYNFWDWSDSLNDGEYIEVSRYNKADFSDVDTLKISGIFKPKRGAISPDGQYLYFTAHNTADNGILARINLSTFTYDTSLDVVGTYAQGLAIDSSGTYAYVSTESAAFEGDTSSDWYVTKVNLPAMTVNDQITVAALTYGGTPYDVVIDGSDTNIYVRSFTTAFGGMGPYYPTIVSKIQLSSFSSGVADYYQHTNGNGSYDSNSTLGIDINDAGTLIYFVESNNGQQFATDNGIIIGVDTSTMTLDSTNVIENQYPVEQFQLDEVDGFIYLAVSLGTFGQYGTVEMRRYSYPGFVQDSVVSSTDSNHHFFQSFFDDTSGRLYFGTSRDGFQLSGAVLTMLETKPAATLRLEYGYKLTTCEAVGNWSTVPAVASLGEQFELVDSGNLTDGEVTTNVAGGVADGNTTFNSGYVMESTDETPLVGYGVNQFTEVEYSLQANANALDGRDYCFRLTDAGDDIGITITNFAEATVGSGGGGSGPGITGGGPGSVRTSYNSAHLDRLQVGQTGVHFTLSFELAGTSGPTDTLSIVFPNGFANIDAGSASATCSGGGTIDNWQDDGDRNAWADKADCAGTVSVEGIYIDLPSIVGTYIIEWSNDNGSGAVAIMDDDQVTVTSNVDPTMLFDIDTSTNNATSVETAAPYTVDFGTLDATSTTVSGEGSVNYIMMDLNTNATLGAVITVRNANGTAGLVSTSVPGDAIANAADTMASGTENYGFCVQAVNTELGEEIYADGDYAAMGICADQADGNDVEALSTSNELIFSVDGPTYGSRTTLSGSAAIDVLTPAHDDYTDTLTFIATSTF